MGPPSRRPAPNAHNILTQLKRDYLRKSLPRQGLQSERSRAGNASASAGEAITVPSLTCFFGMCDEIHINRVIDRPFGFVWTVSRPEKSAQRSTSRV